MDARMLLLLLLLFLTGCFGEDSPREIPQFAFKQEVEVQHGFYKGHKGIIIKYAYVWCDRGQNIAYEVKIKGIGGRACFYNPRMPTHCEEDVVQVCEYTLLKELQPENKN